MLLSQTPGGLHERFFEEVGEEAGSAGTNSLVGGKGADEILGLAGNDKLNSKDGARNDTVNAGGGNDRCTTDPRETSIRACE